MCSVVDLRRLACCLTCCLAVFLGVGRWWGWVFRHVHWTFSICLVVVRCAAVVVVDGRVDSLVGAELFFGVFICMLDCFEISFFNCLLCGVPGNVWEGLCGLMRLVRVSRSTVCRREGSGL